MKFSQSTGLAILAGSPLASALGKTIANAEKKAEYTSGSVMDDIMSKKYVRPLCR